MSSGKNQLTFVQVNLGRCYTSHQVLTEFANRKKIPILLVQEPYTGSSKLASSIVNYTVIQNLAQDSSEDLEARVKSCIYIRNFSYLAYTQVSELCNNNFSAIELKFRQEHILVVSVYIEPDDGTCDEHLHFLDQRIFSYPFRKIIGGDFNARHAAWGDNRNNSRGEKVLRLISSRDLLLLNNGEVPTFERIRNGSSCTSVIDLSMCTPTLLPFLSEWRVEQEMIPGNEHNAISFKISNFVPKTPALKTTYKFKTRNATDEEWESFSDSLDHEITSRGLTVEKINSCTEPSQLDQIVDDLEESLNKSCEGSFRKKRFLPFKCQWMTEEIVEKGKRVARLKKVIRKKKTLRMIPSAPQDQDTFPSQSQELDPSDRAIQFLQEAREDYVSSIRNASSESFKQLVTESDPRDPYSLANKVVKKQKQKLPNSSMEFPSGRSLDEEDTARRILDHFFVSDQSEASKAAQADIDSVNLRSYQRLYGKDIPFVPEEVEERIKYMDPKKAPGLDGFTADICKNLFLSHPELMTCLYNKCLEQGYFPKKWKTSVCKLIPKSDKTNYAHIDSWRPLGLLSILGKILEALMVKRIKWKLNKEKILDENQYGFTEGTSTVDALLSILEEIKQAKVNGYQVYLVSLDIQGAFNNVKWPIILKRLLEYKIPYNLIRLVESYLQDRKVTYPITGSFVEKEINQGCIQGSVGGPDFWNLVLNDIFKIQLPEGTSLKAFADDLSLMVKDKNPIKARDKVTFSLDLIAAWGKENGLKFNANKTQCLAMTNKIRNPRKNKNLRHQERFFPNPSMEGEKIKILQEIKILGVTIDQHLKFTKHVATVLDKADRIWVNLSRITRISWGAHPDILRSLYLGAIEPIVTYACPVWSSALKFKHIQQKVNAWQRKYAQAIAKAYKSCSLNSALALANIPPLDLKIQSLCYVEESKKGLRTPNLEGQYQGKVSFRALDHPARRITVSFDKCNSEKDLEEKLPSNSLAYFTDGSRIPYDQVGAAWVLRRKKLSPDSSPEKVPGQEKNLAEKRIKLGKNCSIFQAELIAIREALEHGIVMKTNDPEIGNDLFLCSDSLSGLTALADRSSKNPIIHKIHFLIRKSLEIGLRWHFLWVKAHVGIQGNESADTLAKDAATSEDLELGYDSYPLSAIKRSAKEILLNEWNARYTQAKHGAITRRYFPSIHECRILWKVKRPGFFSSQALTGHGAFLDYLFVRQFSQERSCNFCNQEIPQDVIHLLESCPYFEDQRIGCRIQMDYCDFLNDQEQKILTKIRFFEQVVKTAYHRNNNRRHQQRSLA